MEWEPKEIRVDVSGKRCQRSGEIHLGGEYSATLKVRWHGGGGETFVEPPTVRVEFPRIRMEVGKFAPAEVRAERVDGDVKTFKLSGSEGSWSKTFTIHIPVIPYKKMQIAFARAEALAKDPAGKTFRKVDWKPLYYGTVGECICEGAAIVTVQNVPEGGGYVVAERGGHAVVMGVEFKGGWVQHKLMVKSWLGPGTLRGERVRLVAKPNPGYVFDHWEDGSREPERVVELKVDGNYLFKAYYRPAPRIEVISFGYSYAPPEFVVRWRGGKPPYRVRIDPGDGSPEIVVRTEKTEVKVRHPYREGEYEATVVVEDSTGLASPPRKVKVRVRPTKVRIVRFWRITHVHPEKGVIDAEFHVSWMGGYSPYTVTLDPGDGGPKIVKTFDRSPCLLYTSPSPRDRG